MKFDNYIQIVMVGGWVMDFSVETYQLLNEEIRAGKEWLNAEDVYGCECWIHVPHIAGARHWTEESRIVYQENHSDEDGSL